jgi:hypothetical protein
LVYTQFVYPNLYMMHDRKPWSEHWVWLAPIASYRACVSELFLNYPYLMIACNSINYHSQMDTEVRRGSPIQHFLIRCHPQTHVVSHTPYVLYKYLNQSHYFTIRKHNSGNEYTPEYPAKNLRLVPMQIQSEIHE